MFAPLHLVQLECQRNHEFHVNVVTQDYSPTNTKSKRLLETQAALGFLYFTHRNTGALPSTTKTSGVVAVPLRAWVSRSQAAPVPCSLRTPSSPFSGIQASTFEPNCPTWVSQARRVVPFMALVEPVWLRGQAGVPPFNPKPTVSLRANQPSRTGGTRELWACHSLHGLGVLCFSMWFVTVCDNKKEVFYTGFH